MNETKGEYGEPWKYDPGSADDEDTIRDRDGGCVIECGPGDMMIEDIERIVACVNSLAGIPNPEAVRELIEAAGALTRQYEQRGTFFENGMKVIAAYRALSAPSASPQQK